MNRIHLSAFKKPALRAMFVILCGSLVLGCSGKRSEQYQLQGDSYYRLNKFGEAEEAYRNAIKSNPENVRAKLGLGRCKIALHRPNEALLFFEETTLLDPQFELGHLETARLLANLGRSEEAIAAAQLFEEVNPELGGLVHTALLLNSGRQAEAQPIVTALRDRFPESTRIRTHIASVLLEGGDPEHAESELNSALEQQPSDSIGIRILLVDAHIEQGKIGAMIQELETNKNRNIEQEIILAYAFLRTDRQEEGAVMAQQALKDNPTSPWAPWASFVYGSYLAGIDKTEAASPYIQMANHELPWEAVIMHHSMSSRYASHSLPIDSRVLRDKSAGSTSGPSETKDWQSLWKQASLQRLLQGRQEFTSQDGDSLKETLVLAALISGDEELAKVLAKDLPADSPMRGYLTALLEGDGQSAIEVLEPWFNKGDAFEVLALNAVGFVTGSAGNRNQAIQILTNCVKRFPENGVSLFLVAKVFRSANMNRQSAQVTRGMIARFPESIDTHIMAVQALLDADMQDEARQSAQVMYALFPDSGEAALLTSRIYVQDKQLEEAARILQGCLNVHPEDLEVKLALASVLFRQRRIDEILPMLDGAVVTEKMAPAYAALEALSHSLKPNWKQVIDGVKAHDAASMSLETRFILFAAYVETGQKDEAAALLVQNGKEERLGGRIGAIISHALNSSSTPLYGGDALLAKVLSSDDAALADFVSGAAYQLAKFYDAAYMAFKRTDSALSVDNDLLLTLQFRNLSNSTRIEDVGKEALTLAEEHASSIRAWLECAAIELKYKDIEREEIALEQALELGTNNAGIFLLRGDFYSRQRDYDAALFEYRRALRIEPDNPVTNNNLAYYILLTGGDVNEALKAAELAARGLANNPNVLHTLGVAQLRSGDLEKSTKNLRAALSGMPSDPSLLLDYGQLLITLGDTEGGRRHIESALHTTQVFGLDFDRQKEAESLLKETATPKSSPGLNTSDRA